MAKYITFVALLLSVAACGDTWGQRAVTGADGDGGDHGAWS